MLINLVLHHDLRTATEQFGESSPLFQLDFNYGNEINFILTYFLYIDSSLQSKLIIANFFKIVVIRNQLINLCDIILQYTTLLLNFPQRIHIFIVLFKYRWNLILMCKNFFRKRMKLNNI